MTTREWVLWVMSLGTWVPVWSSKCEETMRVEERDCRRDGLNVVVMPKGAMP